jgi:para-nitrobenzyl esterase
MRQFLGLPYAAPPVGSLRWRPPQPHNPWTKVRAAAAYGNVCAQNAPSFPGFGYVSDTEDCLYLNVVTPVRRKNATGPLPVMFWIPGGGLFMGGSSDYNPSALVKDGNVVYVSVNYRLNIFGFFSHPAVNAEGHAAGNYGIMDQQYALAWVRDNIEKFGGDPHNVTIFGESGGGYSVWANLASPYSAGLFHKAIILSGGGPNIIPNSLSWSGRPVDTLQSQEAVGEALAGAVGCADTRSASCLRSISTKDLLAATSQPAGKFGEGRFQSKLLLDGKIIPKPMEQIFSSGRFNRVPIINGTDYNEFNFFQAMIELAEGRVMRADDYAGLLALHFGAAATRVAALYPLDRYPTPSDAISAAVGDSDITCSGGRRANRLVKSYVKDIYTYEFNVPDSPISWPTVSFPYQSAHTVELQYLFPLFHGGNGNVHELSEPQKRLAVQFVRYFAAFARTGNPNPGDGAPSWTVYDSDADNYMSIQTPSPIAKAGFGGQHHCDFWDEISSQRSN